MSQKKGAPGQLDGVFQTFNVEDLCDNPYDNEKINRMYRFPASNKEADIHKRANRFGYNAPFMKDETAAPICPCCENSVNTVPIPLCYGTSPDPIVAGEAKFLLNSGTAMYFTFIKMCICYLLLRFLICDAFNMFTSYLGHYCKQNPKQCGGDYNSYLSGYNKHTPEDAAFVDLVSYLNIAVTVASIVYFYYCRKYQYKIFSILEHSQISQEEFSILIENIPIFIYDETTTKDEVKFQYQIFIKNKITEQVTQWIKKVKEYTNQSQIKDYVEKDFYKYITQKNKNIENEPVVASVSLCYDLGEMESLEELRKTLMDEYVNDESVDIKNLEQSQLLKHIPNQIKVINDKHIELSKKFALDNSPAFNLSHYLGKAFVTFQYQHYRSYFLRRAEKEPNFFQINTKTIYIEKPGQPKDVFWTNLKISNEERASTLIQSFVVLMVLLLVSLVILVGVDQIQVIFGRKMGQGAQPDDLPSADSFDSVDSIKQNFSKYTDPNYLKEQILNYIFVVLLPAITNAVNFSITFAISKLTELERHKSKTRKISSFITKNIISRFLNTAIIYYILSVLHQDIGPLTQEGFVIKVMGLIGVNAFVQIVTEMIRPEVVMEFIVNQFNPTQAKEGEEKLFQIQLNEKMQDPEFAFAEQYTFYLVQILLVSFYAVMVPAGVGLLALIFIGQYWIDKYNLFRKFSCPLDFDFFLTRLAFKVFQCSLLVFAIGTFVFDQQIRVNDEPKYKLINLVSVALAGAYVFLAVAGPQWLEQKLFAQEEEQYHKPYGYYLQKKAFRRTYWTENPATAFLKEKNINDGKGVVESPPDDKFVQETEYEKYIALTQDDIKYELYDKADQDYFANYYNDDFDAEAEIIEGSPMQKITEQ